MNSLLDWSLLNREVITLVLTFIVGVIPTLFEVKRTPGKFGFTFWGYLFLIFAIILISFTLYALSFDKRKISQKDISFTFDLKTRHLQFGNDENKLAQKLPKDIFIPLLNFGKAQTSGTFFLQNFQHGRGHTMSTTTIVYKCNNVVVDDIEYFPKSFDDLQKSKIYFKIPLEKFDTNELKMPVYAKLKIRDSTYTSFIDDDGSVEFELK
ncbi:hypothetical protein LK994_14430 [Ferruginibacter lapsinanis]|uniref:hypothetical protein n=1 Tax=Ferruginibacter lapsinanis TaxID=563172 RepID=UPI001E48EE6C|nr:hypothetical protein [Ferruginibacter lapsinanis]UEG49834.1 hypothetical protein LK994_14430 [Ferruginibacter lapsinanis]